MFAQFNDILSVEDVMEALDIGKSKAYELLRTGQIKSIKMKGYRIPKVALKEYVISQARLNMESYKQLVVD